MRGAMFKAAMLLFWGMFALAGVWGGNTCLAADGAPGDAPPAETAPPVLPMPESTPDGWTDAQFAALQRLEIRVKHLDTQPSAPPSRIDALFKVSTFDPLPASGMPQLCIRQVRLQTNFGEIKARTLIYSKQQGQLFGEWIECCLTSSSNFGHIESLSIPEAIHIHSAVADIEPYYGAPAETMLRNVNISALLRTVHLPEVELVSAKGKLPMANNKMFQSNGIVPLTPDFTYLSKNIMVTMADIFMKPDEPDMIYYTLEVLPLPNRSNGFRKIIFQTNLGYYQTTEPASGYGITHGVKGVIKRIVIKDVKIGDRSANLRDALPMLVQNPFKPLPIVTDTGPVPPSPYGIFGP